MIDKQKLISSIMELPEHFSLDELLDRILLLEKIDIGISQTQNGQNLSTSQAKDKLKKWLK